MKADFDIFNIPTDNSELLSGKILISDPFSDDRYFKRAVVLITEYGKNGAVGFVLNKFIAFKIDEILNDFPSIDVPISIGGPVKPDTIHFIHTVGELIPKSQQIFKNVYWGGDFNKVKSLIRDKILKSHQIRFFVGYSGWSANQLEGEISRKAWVVSNTTPANIFRTDIDIWQTVLYELGDKYRFWQNCPSDPLQN